MAVVCGVIAWAIDHLWAMVSRIDVRSNRRAAA